MKQLLPLEMMSNPNQKIYLWNCPIIKWLTVTANLKEQAVYFPIYDLHIIT